MARTALTAQATPSTGSGSTAATGLLVTMTAADAVNFNEVKLTGKQLLLAINSSTTTDYHVTVTSVVDVMARTGDITSFTVTHNAGGNALAAFGPFPLAGWMQTDGNLYFQADNAAILFSILTLP